MYEDTAAPLESSILQRVYKLRERNASGGICITRVETAGAEGTAQRQRDLACPCVCLPGVPGAAGPVSRGRTAQEDTELGEASGEVQLD